MQEDLPLVHISQLRLGVFVSLDMRWIDHPFLFNSFLISSEQQLATLRELGLQTIAYDPSRSEAKPLILEQEPKLPEAPHVSADDRELMAKKKNRVSRMVDHRERMHSCEQAYNDSANSAKAIIADILRNPSQATATAEAMVESVASTFINDSGATVMLVATRIMDETSYQHALNVMVLTMILARGLGLKRDIFEAAGMGALLHDIGKTRIPSGVLRNRNRNKHEEELYRMHCEYGLQYVAAYVSKPVRAAIQEHHECMDGSGFPAGIDGPKINPIARMVAIANRFDNLCNPIAFEEILTPAEALSHMFARESSQFDSGMLAVFIKELGVYPPGSFVRLNTGSIAIVTAVTPGNTLKPTVLAYEPGVPRREALIINLAEVDDVKIECVLKPTGLPRSVIEYLNPRLKLTYFAQRRQA